jgi:hypothetical protein
VKITNLSLAAIVAVGMVSVASADVDMKIGGQAVVYYQTVENGGDSDYFDKDNSRANFALQLNANGDLGNDFGLGIQATALNALGLNKNLVGDANVMQLGGGDVNAAGGAVHDDGSDYFGITKAYLTKKIANTTLKMGRQELPKSLSPLAFSEGWNVTKNTFDAVVAINSDLPDTTLVGAYVSSSNGNGVGAGADMHTFNDLHKGVVTNGAYMLTVANKSLAGLSPTFTYYGMPEVADAMWLDVKADLNKLAGVPVNLAVQGGQIDPDEKIGEKETNAAGVKIGAKAGPAALSLAYSKVSNGALKLDNQGTSVKTPLYTQMVLNQGAIKLNNDTVVLKGVVPVGPGKIIAQYGMTTDNSDAENDSTELDVIYKFKALGTTMLAAYVLADADNADDPTNVIRFWTRYNF